MSASSEGPPDPASFDPAEVATLAAAATAVIPPPQTPRRHEDDPGLSTTFCREFVSPKILCCSSPAARRFLQQIKPKQLPALLFGDKLITTQRTRGANNLLKLDKRDEKSEKHSANEQPTKSTVTELDDIIGTYEMSVTRRSINELNELSHRLVARRESRIAEQSSKVRIDSSDIAFGQTKATLFDTKTTFPSQAAADANLIIKLLPALTEQIGNESVTDVKLLSAAGQARVAAPVRSETSALNLTAASNDSWLYHVEIKTVGRVNAVPCGISIDAFVRPRCLQTVRQFYYEYQKSYATSFDKYIDLISTDDDADDESGQCGLTVNLTTLWNNQVEQIVYNYAASDLKGFISDGAQVLLERLLLQQRWHVPQPHETGSGGKILDENELTFLFLDAHGKMHLSTYQIEHEPCQLNLANGRVVDEKADETFTIMDKNIPKVIVRAIRMVRHVNNLAGIEAGRVEQWFKYDTKNSRGFLLYRHTPGSLVVTKVPNVPPTDSALPLSSHGDDEKEVIDVEDYRDAASEIDRAGSGGDVWSAYVTHEWQDDPELCYQFQLLKENIQLDIRQFYAQNTQLESLVNDFVKYLIVTQPADVYAASADWWYEVRESRRQALLALSGSNKWGDSAEIRASPTPLTVRTLKLGDKSSRQTVPYVEQAANENNE